MACRHEVAPIHIGKGPLNGSNMCFGGLTNNIRPSRSRRLLNSFEVAYMVPLPFSYDVRSCSSVLRMFRMGLDLDTILHGLVDANGLLLR